VPKILERMVSQLEAKGKPKSQAYAIATAQMQKSGNLKKGTNEPTAKGVKRGKMTPAQRAKDRAAKANGGKPADYRYKSKSNSTVKKNG
jgi:hypothetical protein